MTNRRFFESKPLLRKTIVFLWGIFAVVAADWFDAKPKNELEAKARTEFSAILNDDENGLATKPNDFAQNVAAKNVETLEKNASLEKLPENESRLFESDDSKSNKSETNKPESDASEKNDLTPNKSESDESAANAVSEKFDPTGKTDDELLEIYRQKIERLTAKCLELNMPLEAEITQKCWLESEPGEFVLQLVPSELGLSKLPDDATTNQKFWFESFRKLRRSFAKIFFERAKTAALDNRGFDAVRLVRLALNINPDDELVRNVFGYFLYENHWRTAWEIRQLKKGLIDHKTFGWIRKESIPRYENGERYYRGQWISESEEKKLRRQNKDSWRVETEHYQLRTTLSLEEGVRICRLLEDYYEVWERFFYRFVAFDKEWATRFLANKLYSTQRHHIILFQNRDEYLNELSEIEQNIEGSSGGYFPGVKCIFVYEPSDPNDSSLDEMLIHEATHQLFNERRPKTVSTVSRSENDYGPGRFANFWAVEGISVYMETFRQKGNLCVVGGKDNYRFRRAQERSRETGGYMPLAQYAALSTSKFQNYSNVPMLYTQAAGLTSFFLHYDDDKYQNAFIDYLYLVYQQQDDPKTLERLTLKTFDELDREYKIYMNP